MRAIFSPIGIGIVNRLSNQDIGCIGTSLGASSGREASAGGDAVAQGADPLGGQFHQGARPQPARRIGIVLGRRERTERERVASFQDRVG